MIKRLIFSLQMGYRYRHALAEIYRATPSQFHLLQISPSQLKKTGISVIVLDFDGVLSAHGEPTPAAELHQWLQECIAVFGAEQIFILSNKPSLTRIAYFQRHYTGVRWIVEARKKPYPDGLQTIMALTQQPSQAILLVDDRLLTGVLAACIANVSILWVTQCYIQWFKRPCSESWFILLRFLERFLIQGFIWCCQKTKATENKPKIINDVECSTNPEK